MKKFIKSFLVFIPSAVAIYLTLIVIAGEFIPDRFHKNLAFNLGGNGYLFTRLQEARNTSDVDILFLGSSHSIRGFDPRIFREAGYKTFNLGSSSQSPIQTDFLVKEYIDSLNPKLIVYEVYPFVFSIDGVEPSTDVISNEFINWNMLVTIAKQQNVKLYNTFLYSAYKELTGAKSRFKEKRSKASNAYIDGGFVEFNPRNFKHLTMEKNHEYKFKDYQFEAFERTLALIKNKNIEVMFVQAPYTKTFYRSYTNNAFFEEKMKEYGNYYNFNRILSLDDSLHFYDRDHLNQAGVKIFNEYIIEKLLAKTESIGER